MRRQVVFAACGLAVSAVVAVAVRDILKDQARSGAKLKVPLRERGPLPTGEGQLTCGLVNDTTFCFVNAILQSLASCPAMLEFLQSFPDPCTFALDLSYMLKSLNVRTTGRKLRHAAPLLANLFGEHVLTMEVGHQDAHEFLQYLIDLTIDQADTLSHLYTKLGLNVILLKESQSDDVALSIGGNLIAIDRNQSHSFRNTNPLRGLMINDLRCTFCLSRSSRNHIPFENVSIALPRPDLRSCSLQDCLERYHAVEVVSDVQCDQCSIFEGALAIIKQIESHGVSFLSAVNEWETITTVIKTLLLDFLSALLQLKTRMQHILREKCQIADDDVIKLKSQCNTQYFNSVHTFPTVKRNFFKSFALAKLPKILCLHINRIYIHSMGHAAKSHCLVTFPEVLDVSPYCTTEIVNVTGIQSQIVLKASAQMYKLQAVVTHFGMANGGHFVTFRRRLPVEGAIHYNEEAWLYISDEEVKLVTFEMVQQTNPYILFYEKISSEEVTSDLD